MSGKTKKLSFQDNFIAGAFMSKLKTVLVAPINWGLGHAARCIPIINKLLEQNFQVILASDGDALLLLQKEFPSLASVELPSYDIQYPQKGRHFKWKMIRSLPLIHSTIKAEMKVVNQLLNERQIDGIISDGRLGVRSSRVPSVFITHQLQVQTGITTFFSSKLHQFFIRKFDVCWVPDYEKHGISLSGRLGHIHSKPFPIKYVGPLSRLKRKKHPITIDILVLLSGPEPQRTLLEKILIAELKASDQNIVVVRGKMEEEQKWEHKEGLKIVNFVLSEELEDLINQSELIIARSGYSTIMDLATLGKKAYFIPTPGQYEQGYLAGRMEWTGMAPSCSQTRFHIRKLRKIRVYKGLDLLPIKSPEFTELFEIFLK